MKPVRYYLEKKILALAGIFLSLFGGTLLLMAVVSAGLVLLAPFMGETKEGLRAAVWMIPLLLGAAGCLVFGLFLRDLPITPGSVVRSAGEAVALPLSAFWTIRVTSVSVSGWEIAAYLMLLSLFFYWGIHSFRQRENGVPPSGK